MGLAKSSLALGKPDIALDKIEELLKNRPENVFALNLKGELLSRQGDKKKAIKALKKANELKPDWATPYRNLAALHLQEGDVKSAEKTYKQGAEKAKEKDVLLMALAALYVEKSRIDDAVKVYDQMLGEGLAVEAVRNNLAMVLSSFKKNDQKSLQRALELSSVFRESKNPSYLDTYGWALLKNNQLDLAVETLQKAASRAPESAVIQYHLGNAFHAQRQYDLAVTHLQRAVDSSIPFEGKEEAEKLLSEARQQMESSASN